MEIEHNYKDKNHLLQNLQMLFKRLSKQIREKLIYLF